jgi:hypothetical protein
MRELVKTMPLLLFSAVTLAGCDVIAGIFKAGVWVGVIAVIAVIALIIWLITRMVS